MSAPFSVLAPGKLVLIGEYAVLDGAPALVLAVDRGVRCDVLPGGAGVRISTPDGDDRFVRPALEGAPAGTYRFSDHLPVDLPGKPGFGGSAAACVAACVAAGRPAEHARSIHHDVQGGGSGIDVAASVHGGVLRFQSGEVQPAQAPDPVVVYSGSSAKTGPRVAAYREWQRAHDQGSFLDDSRALVAAFASAPAETALSAVDLLQAMADQAGFTYLTPGLARIVALAREHGGGAKPSGAGGGDVAVAWLPDPTATAAFLAACATEGLPPIEIFPGTWGTARGLR